MGANPVNLSASRGAAILGLSKYKSPLRAWLEIMEIRKPGFCQTNGFYKPERADIWAEPINKKHAAMRWGLGFENAICDLVGNVTDREREFQHPEHDFITCHIDGMHRDIIQENKTAFDMAFRMAWGRPGTDEISEEYVPQVQHQMMCTRKEIVEVNALVFPRTPAEWEEMGYRIDLGGLISHPKSQASIPAINWAKNLLQLDYFHKFTVRQNPKLQKEMLDRYLEFWNVNVLGETPPPAQGYDDIKWLFASPEGEIEATKEIAELWDEYNDIGLEIDDMIKRKEEIKNTFAHFVDNVRAEKGIKPGSEKRKLNVYHGPKKLFSVSRPYPRTKVSASTVDTLSEAAPELYEEMKALKFTDIIGEIELTEKQAEKRDELDKFLGKLKATKLLSRNSIMGELKKSRPDLYKRLQEFGVLVDSEPVSRINISKGGE